MNEQISGNLIIIGGAEDKKGDKEILKKVANFIDKENESILIATVATEYPEESFNNYHKVFTKLGVKNINKLDISNRKDSNDEEKIKLVKEADLIFFTGGDQLRITSLLGGTSI